MPLPKLRFRRPSPAMCISLAALVVAMGGFAIASIPGPSGVIKGCYDKDNGDLRVVDSSRACAHGEKALRWNKRGRPGPEGPAGTAGSAGPRGLQGPQGLQGPAGSDAEFSGATAGGDLTGTYPNPTIGGGKVTSSKIFDGTIAAVDLTAAIKDGAAGTPSLRSLGTGATQAMPGNATPGGPPTGSAGGDLAGSTYPNPVIANDAVTPAKISGIPTARAFNSTSYTIAASTFTVLTMDSENYDVGVVHSTSTNTSRLTAPVAGTYAISATVDWSTQNSGEGTRSAELVVNGTTPAAYSTVAPKLGTGVIQNLATQYQLAVDDYVELGVYQDTTTAPGNVSVNSNALTHVEMTLIAPS